MQRKRQIILVLVAFACILGSDQASKAIVRAKLEPDDLSFWAQPPKFFRFSHQTNPGLVGGAFSSNRLVTFSAPVIASFVLLYLFRHLDPKSRVQSVAYGMVAGGAVGNLIDRFRLGAVTDFLQFHFHFIPFDFPWKRYPAFNVADSGICIGVFLLVITWHIAGKDDVADAA